MIQHQPYANYFVVTCDQCGRLDSISTVKTAAQAKQIATTRFRWKMDTAAGDLCRRCAGAWRDGSVDAGRVEARELWAGGQARAVPSRP